MHLATPRGGSPAFGTLETESDLSI